MSYLWITPDIIAGGIVAGRFFLNDTLKNSMRSRLYLYRAKAAGQLWRITSDI
jgi:hypothetical protein